VIRPDHRPNLPLALLSASLVLLLGACAPQPTESAQAPEPAPAEATPPTADGAVDMAADPGEAPQACDADPVQGLIGQEATEDVVAQATADSGSASVRVLKPGQPATMDYRQDRLNIMTDDAGVIEQLNCG
jgi:hypothetical protein